MREESPIGDKLAETVPMPPAGDLVGGRFRLQEELGRGGMGVVWRAEDDEEGGLVALKILPEEVARDPAAVKRLEREAERLRALDHPGIARVVAFGIHETEGEGPLSYLALEYLEGPSLGEVLAEEGAFPVSEVVEYLRPVAEAIDHAHRNKVVHMDLKPGNVLFTAAPEDGGTPKLIDFGIAHELHETLSMSREELEAELEEEPLLQGTPAYMSPEQFRSEPPRATTDIWALAVTAYQMLDDRLPFSGSPAARRRQILELDPDPVALELDEPGVAPAVNQALLRGLAKDRKERFQTATALIRALEAAILPTPDSTPVPERPLLGPWWGGYLVAGGLILLAGLILDPFGADRIGKRRPKKFPEFDWYSKLPASVEGNFSVWDAYFLEAEKARRRGDHQAAEAFYELAREEGRRIHGRSAQYYRSLMSLASFHQERGDHDKALELFRKAKSLK